MTPLFYIVSTLFYNLLYMTDTQTKASADQDSAAAQAVSGLSLAQIEKYLVSDLAVVRTLLAAIHDDPNCLRAIATHLHGRAQNYNAAQASLKDVPIA